MAIAFDRAQRPLRQLRRSLKTVPATPLPEDVHKLRTSSRRIEAIVAALSPAGDKLSRRVLKSIKPLRKAAGNVRDMDVLAERAQRLPLEPHGESVASLLEALRSLRKKHAEGLVEAIEHHRKQAREHLKQYTAQIEKRRDSAPLAREAERRVRSAAASHAQELASWPALSARNLHGFRLKVKELRTVLQLLANADSTLIRDLRAAKDQIGEWHDWLELGKTAAQALDTQQHGALLALIRHNHKQKLSVALTAANALRERHLEGPLKKPPVSEPSSQSTPERRSPVSAVTGRPNQAA